MQLEQHCLYPPRFTIVVSGERATDNSHAEILFKGIKDGAQDEIPLIVPLQSQHGEQLRQFPPPPKEKKNNLSLSDIGANLGEMR